MTRNHLAVFGFSEEEYLVYAILVAEGACSVVELAKKSNLHRPRVYTLLVSLIDRKAIYKHTDKKWRAVPPRELQDLLEQEKETAFIHLDVLNKKYKDEHSPRTSLMSYEGKDGVRSIFNDVVLNSKKGDIFYRFTSETDTEYVNSLLSREYRLIRDKKQLERLVISNQRSAQKKKSRLEREIKVLDEKETQFTENCIQLIYNGRVAFINVTTLTGYIIIDEQFSLFQQEIFKTLYKKLPKVTKEFKI